MAFDDLARHMASRDKRKLGAAGSADEFAAEMANANRRMNRTRDLLLGSILLVGGLVIAVLLVVIYIDLFDQILHPERATQRISARGMTMVFAGAAMGVLMVIMGSVKIFRGIRGR